MADDRLLCFLLESITATKSYNFVSRSRAISLRLFQKASSTLMLVLCPAIRIGLYDDERFLPHHLPFRHGERPGCLVPRLHDEPLPLFVIQTKFRHRRSFGLPFVRCLNVNKIMGTGPQDRDAPGAQLVGLP